MYVDRHEFLHLDLAAIVYSQRNRLEPIYGGTFLENIATISRETIPPTIYSGDAYPDDNLPFMGGLSGLQFDDA
jgi:hypothetical protein